MKKFFAIVCAILFILLAPLTVVATVIQTKFFTPQGVKFLVRSSQIGEHLPQILGSVFTTLAQQEVSQEESQPGEETTSGDPFAQFGGQEVFEDALSKVLPPEDVYAILDQSVDIIFVWWKADQPVEQLPLVVDLSKPKQRLAPIVLESVRQYVEDLPTCSAEQLKEMEGSDLPDVFSLTCTPEGFSFDSFADAGISEQALSDILLASVPDQFNVQEFLLQMRESDPGQLLEVNRQVDSVRRTLNIANIVLRVLQILMLVCFILVGVLRLTPAKAFFAWIGWTVLLPGLILLLFSGLSSFLPVVIEENILATNPDAAEIVPVVQVVTSVVQSIFRPILWTGVILSGTGLISIILGKIYKHRKGKTPAKG